MKCAHCGQIAEPRMWVRVVDGFIWMAMGVGCWELSKILLGGA